MQTSYYMGGQVDYGLVDNDVSEAEEKEGELPQALLELEKEVLAYFLTLHFCTVHYCTF